MRVLRLAEQKDLLVGSAPDTFFGGGMQTCRKLLDDGWIGTPIAATAFYDGKRTGVMASRSKFFSIKKVPVRCLIWDRTT
ncbi:hypothetical protein GCM10020331_036460 [Ectobacillus funiculus]